MGGGEGEFFGTLFFPEEEGLDVEVEDGIGGAGSEINVGGGGIVEMEVEVEGATEEGAGPC